MISEALAVVIAPSCPLLVPGYDQSPSCPLLVSSWFLGVAQLHRWVHWGWDPFVHPMFAVGEGEVPVVSEARGEECLSTEADGVCSAFAQEIKIIKSCRERLQQCLDTVNSQLM